MKQSIQTNEPGVSTVHVSCTHVQYRAESVVCEVHMYIVCTQAKCLHITMLYIEPQELCSPDHSTSTITKER